MTDFFHMGGYAFYIWPAYGLAALVMIGVLLTSIRAVRLREQELTQLQQLRPRRERRPAAAEPTETPAP